MESESIHGRIMSFVTVTSVVTIFKYKSAKRF